MTDLVADLVARERHAREESARHADARADYAIIRRDILNRLHEALGTWQKVADATGQKLPTVHKAAKQPKTEPCCPAYAEHLAGIQRPGHSPDCPTVHKAAKQPKRGTNP